MNIMLVNAVSPLALNPSPPLGLVSIGSFLKSKGFENIRIIDVPMDNVIFDPLKTAEEIAVEQHLLKEFSIYKPNIVGISTFSEFYHITHAICRAAKRIDDRIHVIVGGPHATLASATILSTNPYVDYVVRGEGELTFLELVEKLNRTQDITGTAGVSHIRNGVIHHEKNRPLIKDINCLPSPMWELLPSLNKYVNRYQNTPFLPIVVGSRGCPYHCSFCASSRIWLHNGRVLSPQRVADEIAKLKKVYRASEIIYVDDMLGVDEERALSLCALLRDSGTNWWCMTRADHVTKRLTQMMREGGCMGIGLGIESANQIIRNRVYNKGISNSQIINAISLIQEAKISVSLSFIFGPYDSISTIRDHVHFLKSIKPLYTHFNILNVYPGTDLRERIKKDGLITSRTVHDPILNLEMHRCLGLYPVKQGLSNIQKGLRSSYIDLLCYKYSQRELEVIACIISLVENRKWDYYRNATQEKESLLINEQQLCEKDYEISYQSLDMAISNRGQFPHSLSIEFLSNFIEPIFK